jgi:hypothetical protein
MDAEDLVQETHLREMGPLLAISQPFAAAPSLCCPGEPGELREGNPNRGTC